MLRYRYRITYFDICGARAIDPWFATVLLCSLLYFISILIQPILQVDLSVIYGDACQAVSFLQLDVGAASKYASLYYYHYLVAISTLLLFSYCSTGALGITPNLRSYWTPVRAGHGKTLYLVRHTHIINESIMKHITTLSTCIFLSFFPPYAHAHAQHLKRS